MSLLSKKVVFMGTPRFASEILENLIKKGVQIDCVFTQPDKPVGRKAILTETPVKKSALKFNLELRQEQRLTKDVIAFIENRKPDLIIVAAYGIILPKEVLRIPTFGCINIHASLLPEFRGSSPIHATLKQGRKESGISIMLMDEGIDTGPVFSKKSVLVDKKDRYLELENKLIELSNEVLVPILEKIIKKEIEPVSQNEKSKSLTQMIKKQDGKIDWYKQSARDIFNAYRAFHLWPKTYAFFEEKNSKRKITLTFSDYTTENYQQEIGQIFKNNDNLLIQTINGALLIQTIQLEGKKELLAKDFINGKPNFIRTILK